MPVSSQHKVYLPAQARDNQYLLAEFVLTDELLAAFPANDAAKPYEHFYQQLAQQFFELADAVQLHNVHVIANGKTPVVRFHQEAYVLQTAEQILFFYNPSYHEAQHSFYDAKVRARKISLLFLATEQPLRSNAAAFHQQVTTLLTELRNRLVLAELKIKVRDHQHLTKADQHRECAKGQSRLCEPDGACAACEDDRDKEDAGGCDKGPDPGPGKQRGECLGHDLPFRPSARLRARRSVKTRIRIAP